MPVIRLNNIVGITDRSKAGHRCKSALIWGRASTALRTRRASSLEHVLIRVLAMSAFGERADMAMNDPNVRFWHKAEITIAPPNVCFEGAG
jgi:hypothetical protein